MQVLIHYLGDENIAEDFPHGNQKKHMERNYCKQCPSMVEALQEEISNSNPSDVYKAQVASTSCHPSHVKVFIPRDVKMVLFFVLQDRMSLFIFYIVNHVHKTTNYQNSLGKRHGQ